VVDGLRSAIARGSDVVIVDTAGRLHTKANLMEELRKIRRVAERECPGAPHETLLVLDASTGQNGLQQARLFQEAVAISGIVLTKLDGTARGGIAVAVAVELGVPIRFIGIGEGVDDLRPFQADEFVDALLLPETEGSPLIRNG
jgi:fused signal recognition particle receptor